MKKTVALIVVGIIGLSSYIYFQFSSLAYVVDGVVQEYMGGVPVVVDVIYHRDWTLGIVGAIVGVALLGWGVYRLRRRNAWERS